jgi:hypothetical protein
MWNLCQPYFSQETCKGTESKVKIAEVRIQTINGIGKTFKNTVNIPILIANLF